MNTESTKTVPTDHAGPTVTDAVAAAVAAAPTWAATTRADRAAACDAIAAALEADGEAIVAAASEESHYPPGVLTPEVTRTAYQWRFFGEVVRDGGYLDAAVDHAGTTPAGPRPDLRRMLVPIGPVAVFGASNFPIAFSTAGGDTASALAVGCPVIVKTHPSHPRTSRLVTAAVRRALAEVGAPNGVFDSVEGFEAGGELVTHPDIEAVAFTGSLVGGKALLDAINARPTPIPFYGELSSINPVVVTVAAARENAEAVAKGLVTSYTTRAGQVCTKPGVVFVPAGEDGDRFVTVAAEATRSAAASELLNPGIQAAYDERTGGYPADARVEVVAVGSQSADGWATPTLVAARAADVDEDLLEECFGPTTLLIRYDGTGEVRRVIGRLDGSLTATVHHGSDDEDTVRELMTFLQPLAGRLLFGGFPTGVSVAWAQHHGGPWPSTNTLHTSVGASSARRFLRPVCWQDAPAFILPDELRDGAALVPTRIDGVLQVPG